MKWEMLRSKMSLTQTDKISDIRKATAKKKLKIKNEWMKANR